ncbi:MAG: hypothetical protein HZC17_08840 [Candidatus Omnitrophica bacterium]|nr:hypothetical protein [Candidatus Omnitrophota bacterium]
MTIKKLARELYEKPGVRLTQSVLQKRMTIEAPASFINQLGPVANAQILEIPSQDELAAMKIAPQELNAYALVHAASLGRVEGNLADPMIKPFRTNIERDSITGIFRLVRNSLAERIAFLEASIAASRKILAAA